MDTDITIPESMFTPPPAPASAPVSAPAVQKKSNPLPDWDALDALPLHMLPQDVLGWPLEQAHAEAQALAAQGIRSAVGRALCARDLVINHAYARYYQTLLAVAVDSLGRGNGNEKRIRLLSDLVDRQARRLTASCELLLRLEATPTPSFRIQADQAAFLVDNGSSAQKNNG